MTKSLTVRANFRNFRLGQAFFSRIWHAVVLTQFGNADSKSAPWQAIFCVLPTQNSKTKWPPKLVKMSQLYITAWLTMNIKHYFGVIKPTWATYLTSPKFHLVRLPLEDTSRQCAITLLPNNVEMCFWFLHIGCSHPGNQFRAVITSIINMGKNKCCARKTTHRSPV